MSILITIVHIAVCFILILVILLQAGRGQGLTGSSFGSGNVQSLFGTRAGDVLSKATTIAAICFLFTCIGLNFIETRKSKSLLELGRQQQATPLDVDQIKKALEKVKAESAELAEKTGADVQAVVDDAKAKVAVPPVAAKSDLPLPDDAKI